MKCGDCSFETDDEYECEDCEMQLCQRCAKHAHIEGREMVLCSACERERVKGQ